MRRLLVKIIHVVFKPLPLCFFALWIKSAVCGIGTIQQAKVGGGLHLSCQLFVQRVVIRFWPLHSQTWLHPWKPHLERRTQPSLCIENGRSDAANEKQMIRSTFFSPRLWLLRRRWRQEVCKTNKIYVSWLPRSCLSRFAKELTQ